MKLKFENTPLLPQSQGDQNSLPILNKEEHDYSSRKQNTKNTSQIATNFTITNIEETVFDNDTQQTILTEVIVKETNKMDQIIQDYYNYLYYQQIINKFDNLLGSTEHVLDKFNHLINSASI